MITPKKCFRVFWGLSGSITTLAAFATASALTVSFLAPLFDLDLILRAALAGAGLGAAIEFLGHAIKIRRNISAWLEDEDTP